MASKLSNCTFPYRIVQYNQVYFLQCFSLLAFFRDVFFDLSNDRIDLWFGFAIFSSNSKGGLWFFPRNWFVPWILPWTQHSSMQAKDLQWTDVGFYLVANLLNQPCEGPSINYICCLKIGNFWHPLDFGLREKLVK